VSKMLGADVLVKCLIQEDVRFVFGIPGGQLTTLLDAIHRFGRQEGLDFIMTRHEQAAAHMADTFSRLTGRPGVCLGTVGPGAVEGGEARTEVVLKPGLELLDEGQREVVVGVE